MRVIRQITTDTLRERTIRHIGIDDWAVKKGRNYGTIIVDLERHDVIDLLPDRKAATVAQWLQDHPNIEVITRDRSPDYINGTRAGAPKALQVADRWHLLLNLSQMVERFLGTIHTKLRKLPMAEQYKQMLQAQRATFQRTKIEQQLSTLSRDRRVARYEQVQQLRREGYNITQIARMLNCKWETARDYFYPSEFPERQSRGACASIIDPYIPYLIKRLAEGCETATLLWREIQLLGYPGSYKPVVRWIRQYRTRPTSSGTRIDHDKMRSPSYASSPRLPSSKQLAWVMVKDPEQLTDTERLCLDHIQQESTVVKVYELAQQFIAMIKHAWANNSIHGSPRVVGLGFDKSNLLHGAFDKTMLQWRPL